MKRRGGFIAIIIISIITLVSFNVFAEKNNKIEKSPLDFSLFASENIHINGADIKINGDVWANNSLTFFGTSFNIKGSTWSSNDIKANGTYIDNLWQNFYASLTLDGEANKVSSPMEMPDMISEIEEVAMKNAVVYNEDKTITDKDLDSSSIIVKGGAVSGILSRLNNYIIADDSISINITQKNENENENKPIVIASKKYTYTPKPYELSTYESSIYIDGNNMVIVGNIYAPNGNVRIKSNNICIMGNIIARNIYLEGSIISVNDENKENFKEDL